MPLLAPLARLAEERMRLAEDAMRLARGLSGQCTSLVLWNWWGWLMWDVGRRVRSVGCQIDLGLGTQADMSPEDFDQWLLGGGWEALRRAPGHNEYDSSQPQQHLVGDTFQDSEGLSSAPSWT